MLFYYYKLLISPCNGDEQNHTRLKSELGSNHGSFHGYNRGLSIATGLPGKK